MAVGVARERGGCLASALAPRPGAPELGLQAGKSEPR